MSLNDSWGQVPPAPPDLSTFLAKRTLDANGPLSSTQSDQSKRLRWTAPLAASVELGSTPENGESFIFLFKFIVFVESFRKKWLRRWRYLQYYR